MNYFLRFGIFFFVVFQNIFCAGKNYIFMELKGGLKYSDINDGSYSSAVAVEANFSEKFKHPIDGLMPNLADIDKMIRESIYKGGELIKNKRPIFIAFGTTNKTWKRDFRVDENWEYEVINIDEDTRLVDELGKEVKKDIDIYIYYCLINKETFPYLEGDDPFGFTEEELIRREFMNRDKSTGWGSCRSMCCCCCRS